MKERGLFENNNDNYVYGNEEPEFDYESQSDNHMNELTKEEVQNIKEELKKFEQFEKQNKKK